MKTEKFTCGNYEVTFGIKAEVVFDEKLTPLLHGGITQILQRKPASAWEKAEAGYEKRPEGFKRESIPFSPEAADRMKAIMSEAVKDWAIIEVGEYVPEEKVGKFKEEIEIIARHESEDDVEEWLEKKVGFVGEYVDSDTDSGYSLEALKAVNAYKRKMAKLL